MMDDCGRRRLFARKSAVGRGEGDAVGEALAVVRQRLAAVGVKVFDALAAGAGGGQDALAQEARELPQARNHGEVEGAAGETLQRGVALDFHAQAEDAGEIDVEDRAAAGFHQTWDAIRTRRPGSTPRHV